MQGGIFLSLFWSSLVALVMACCFGIWFEDLLSLFTLREPGLRAVFLVQCVLILSGCLLNAIVAASDAAVAKLRSCHSRVAVCVATWLLACCWFCLVIFRRG